MPKNEQQDTQAEPEVPAEDQTPRVAFIPRRKRDGELRLTAHAGPEAKEVVYIVSEDKPAELAVDHPHVELFRGPWADFVKEA